MGMWDKDKEMGRRLDSVFSIGDYLIVWGIRPDGTVPTDLGDARKTVLDCAPLNSPEDRGEVQTLASAIADKAELAEPSDFPAVCQLLRIESKDKQRNPALVLQYVRDYDDGATHAAPVPSAADEDIPY